MSIDSDRERLRLHKPEQEEGLGAGNRSVVGRSGVRKWDAKAKNKKDRGATASRCVNANRA